MHRCTDGPISRSLLSGICRISVGAPSMYGHRTAHICRVACPRGVTATLGVRNKFGKCNVPPMLLLVASSVETFVGGNRHGRPFISNNLFSVSLLCTLRTCNLTAYPLGTVFDLSRSQRAHTLLGVPSCRLPIVCVTMKGFPRSMPIYHSAQQSPGAVIGGV